jgi:hypothetical protein
VSILIQFIYKILGDSEQASESLSKKYKINQHGQDLIYEAKAVSENYRLTPILNGLELPPNIKITKSRKATIVDERFLLLWRVALWFTVKPTPTKE